jgi:hypothetical protein
LKSLEQTPNGGTHKDGAGLTQIKGDKAMAMKAGTTVIAKCQKNYTPLKHYDCEYNTRQNSASLTSPECVKGRASSKITA